MAQDVTTLKAIEQGRATYAFDAVKSVTSNKELTQEELKRLKESYKSAAKKLPVLIQTNGLGQTLAFVKSKGGKIDKKTGEKVENGYDKLYDQIGTWLQNKNAKNS